MKPFSARKTNKNTIRPMPRPGRALAAYLATDKEFRGIGPALASRLEAQYGHDLHHAMLAKDQGIIQILGEEVAEISFAAYDYKVHELDVVDWLQSQKVDVDVGVPIALRIARCWGGEATQALKDNPYVLLAFLPWDVVDRVAQRLGVAEQDQRRAVAAVEATLYEHLDTNSTLVSLKDAKNGLMRRFGKLPRNVSIEEIIANMIEGGAAARLGADIQPYGAAIMEADLASWITKASNLEAFTDLSMPRDDRVYERIEAFAAQSPHPLTEKQRDAIHTGVTARLSVLAGYAGSGKTTCLRGVCDVATDQGRELHLMALSGRATQRMMEATGHPARTIAAFLSNVRNGAFKPAPGSVIIIDEASMLDLPTLWRIHRILGEASLMLVGDPAQLPPIGFGLTFHVLCKASAVKVTTLDKVLRQSEESGIPTVAEAVRHGRIPDLPSGAKIEQGVSFDVCEPEHAIQRIHLAFKQLVASGYSRDEIQILSPIKAGPAGSDAINSSFHHMKREQTGAHLFPGRDDIAEDDPIMWTRNDWSRGLTNGSLGRLQTVFDGLAHATIDGNPFDLTASDAECLAPAYSFSVHKAQGSQWPAVIIPIFPSKVLDRTLLYTALTRAEKRVVFIGDRSAFEHAITSTPSVENRKTGLLQRLKEN
ncbi:AAA family ATPase [Donghicola eburneus]|uniref:Uncharacterized protein n=1 Tax=Donghicola eburneus TaxID=393278 RepID=A0A1M4N2J0_9RHOB|nr:AAA family ATPase [Donghicola eburneus]SCM68317.1 hypothetical protein KARMA_2534 [Donghicola eburneus]